MKIVFRQGSRVRWADTYINMWGEAHTRLTQYQRNLRVPRTLTTAYMVLHFNHAISLIRENIKKLKWLNWKIKFSADHDNQAIDCLSKIFGNTSIFKHTNIINLFYNLAKRIQPVLAPRLLKWATVSTNHITVCYLNLTILKKSYSAGWETSHMLYVWRFLSSKKWSSYKEHIANALAMSADEGRGKQRKAVVSC